MNNTPTPHNSAVYGEIAPKVLMPGDPLRAKYIAENFLEAPKLVNSVRNMFCYTGTCQGKELSVMGSGMGPGSIGIYAYELYNFYGVESIIRVGSAGGMQPDVKKRDVVIAMTASTNSNYYHIYNLPGFPAFPADYDLLEKAVNYARSNGTNYHVGMIYSSDVFYLKDFSEAQKYAAMGCLATEMETAILYALAADARKKALAICTISDSLIGDDSPDLTAEERQTSMNDMIRMALEII